MKRFNPMSQATRNTRLVKGTILEDTGRVDSVLIEVEGEMLHQYGPTDEVAKSRLEYDIDRLRDLLALVANAAKGCKVLELGAAPFFLTTALVQSGFEVTANGLPMTGHGDVATVIIHERDGREHRVPLHCFDIEEAFPLDDACFDIVIGGEVFEHLYRQPWVMLHEAWRCLSPGGVLIISTPNGHALEALYTWLRRNSTGMGFNPDAPSIRHAREYGMYEVCELMHASGFDVDKLFTKSYSHVGPGGYPGTLGPLKKGLASVLKHRSERSDGFLSNRGNTILLCATRREDSELRIPDFMKYGWGDPRTGYNFS